MRSLWLVIVLVSLLTACMPNGPTGNAVAPPTHWVDGSNVLISYESWEEPLGVPSTRVTVTGDLVMDRILVDGEEHFLSGRYASGEWLEGRGTALLRLSPGEHEVRAYSCFESLTGWDCGCRNPDDCSHWMARTVSVK